MMEALGLWIVFLNVFFLSVNGDGCPPGLYGSSCDELCGHCLGGNSFCHPETGVCHKGCSSGYTNKTCHDRCAKGTYGLGCTKLCSEKCRRQTCDSVDGSCEKAGCAPGFMGKFCSEACPPGKYGPGCTNTCRCGKGCMCSPVEGTCLKKGCEFTPETKKKRSKRMSVKPRTQKVKDDGKTGLMCSDMAVTFRKLRLTLNKRVDIPITPMLILMFIATVVIIFIGVM